MAVDFYLQFLDKNNKGKRVTTLNENVNIKPVATGLPDYVDDVDEFTDFSGKTIQKGDLILPVVDIASFKETIFTYSNGHDTGLNQSVCVLGDPGMGKSAIVLDTARKINTAKYGNTRQFVPLSDITDRPKGKEVDFNDVWNNPGKYYIFLDVRMTAYEKYELKGVPFPSKEAEGTMVSLFERWMGLLFLPDAAGMLFLDEINQSDFGTQTALYGLLHKDERTIAGRAIANKDGWSVHGAGNLPEDAAGVEPLLAALQDRFNNCWLEVTYESWLEWASTAQTEENGKTRAMLHPLILGFLAEARKGLDEEKFKNVFIQQGNAGGTQGANAPNPRNFVSVSEVLFTQDQIIKKKNAQLAAEIKSLEADYNKQPEGTPNRRTAYAALQAKQKEKQDLVKGGYLRACYDAAVLKINPEWANEFKRYILALKVNIHDIFAFDKEADATRSIEQKLTYRREGKTTGSSARRVTNAMGQLEGLIEQITVQFVEACGMGEYLKGNIRMPHPKSEPEEYKQFTATLPKNVNKNIQADFKYIETIYLIMRTQIAQGEKDLAAMTYSYFENVKYNGVHVFPLIKFAISNNCTPQQLKKLTDEQGKQIEFSKKAQKDAMNSLMHELGEEFGNYAVPSKGSLPEEAEENMSEEEAEDNSLDHLNQVLQMSINIARKVI